MALSSIPMGEMTFLFTIPILIHIIVSRFSSRMPKCILNLTTKGNDCRLKKFVNSLLLQSLDKTKKPSLLLWRLLCSPGSAMIVFIIVSGCDWSPPSAGRFHPWYCRKPAKAVLWFLQRRISVTMAVSSGARSGQQCPQGQAACRPLHWEDCLAQTRPHHPCCVRYRWYAVLESWWVSRMECKTTVRNSSKKACHLRLALVVLSGRRG